MASEKWRCSQRQTEYQPWSSFFNAPLHKAHFRSLAERPMASRTRENHPENTWLTLLSRTPAELFTGHWTNDSVLDSMAAKAGCAGSRVAGVVRPGAETVNRRWTSFNNVDLRSCPFGRTVGILMSKQPDSIDSGRCTVRDRRPPIGLERNPA